MSSLSAIAVMSLVVMFPVLLSLRRTDVPGAASFCLACILSALSAGTGFASTIAPQWIHTVAGSTLMIAASLTALNGLREFLGRKPLGRRSLAALLACVSMLLGAFSFTVGNPGASLALSAGLASLIHVLTGVTIMRHWSRERAVAPYALFCCVSAFALAALHATGVAAAAADFSGTGEPQIWTTALLASRHLAMPLFLPGVILLLHGWMIANLRHMIAHDELTGALSRRAFMAEYERVFRAAAASGQETAFMLLDLDRFKQINDVHGHAGGDVALAHFSGIVRETLAGRGIFGRLGGEEFGVVATGIDRQEAVQIAGEICAAVRTTPASAFNGMDITLTVSIGIAIAEPGCMPADVMVQADMALYDAKAAGRDRLSIAGGLHLAPEASARALAAAAAQMRAAASMFPPQSLSGTG